MLATCRCYLLLHGKLFGEEIGKMMEIELLLIVVKGICFLVLDF
jgi:hypothetical protein